MSNGWTRSAAGSANASTGSKWSAVNRGPIRLMHWVDQMACKDDLTWQGLSLIFKPGPTNHSRRGGMNNERG